MLPRVSGLTPRLKDQCVIHWCLNEMAFIFWRRFQTDFLICKVLYFDYFALSFVAGFPTSSKSLVVQVVAWHRTGDRPLPETMMILICNAIWRHQATMDQYIHITLIQYYSYVLYKCICRKYSIGETHLHQLIPQPGRPCVERKRRWRQHLWLCKVWSLPVVGRRSEG